MSANDPQKETITELVDRVLNQKQSWSKHMAHTCCRCQKCTCGKHLCKFQPLKIGLKPGNSTYNNSYQRNQDKYGGSQSRIKVPIDSYHPRQFIQKSQYQEQYYRKKAKQQKDKNTSLKKPDNIQLGGPSFNQSTYRQNYVPKYATPPQKIKNPQNLTNSRSRMNGTSNYRYSYNWSGKKQSSKRQPIKRENNLKTNSSTHFYGQSSYEHDYLKMKPFSKEGDNFAPHQVYHPTHGVRPKSSYRADYVGKSNQVCPALKCPSEKCC